MMIDEDEMYNSMAEYLIMNDQKEEENTAEVLSCIKMMVSEERYKDIENFVKDPENGIWGGLELVVQPIGRYQEEADWGSIEGIWVNQSCGFSGDDYNGTQEIKIKDDMYLRCHYY